MIKGRPGSSKSACIENKSLDVIQKCIENPHTTAK